MRAAMLLSALIVIAAGAAAQPALVDRTFDGLSLHIRCGGERAAGAPLVLFEAGAGFSADTWRDVHLPVSQFARACAWDRPGRGSSAMPRKVLDAPEYVPLVAGLLTAASEPGPYVLVGHSIGGIIAGLFANAYPSQVVGMVLVDASHEAQVRRFSEVRAKYTGGGSATPAMPPTPPPGAPSPEPLPIRPLIDLLGKQPWRGDVPLIVLTRGKLPPATEASSAALAAVWDELQKDWASRSPRGKQIIAANSGHFIQNDEPQLVIDAIRSVLESIKTR